MVLAVHTIAPMRAEAARDVHRIDPPDITVLPDPAS
jgi:hypothetical protein